MRETKNILFEKAAAEWLETVQLELKQSSLVRYTNILQTHLLPEFEGVPITEITREQAIHYRGWLLQSGGKEKGGLSPKTVVIIFSVLRRILSFSEAERGCEVTDLSTVTIRQATKPLRVFSLAEQKKLNQYLTVKPSLSNTGILLSLYTRLRIGEVCALKWEDISLEDWTIYIHRTMQRVQTFREHPRTNVIITEPKSPCSVRLIPIPEFLHDYFLKNQKEPDCFFLTGSARKYTEPRSLENKFRRILNNCDIQGATYHTLRHTFATRCIEQGFDIKTLSEILGHANVTITMNRYVHPSMEFKRKSMEMLSALFASQ